jgi:N4-(beta-N-acetylglucosaminyl)-L-asparaginase
MNREEHLWLILPQGISTFSYHSHFSEAGMSTSRREFLKQTSVAGVGALIAGMPGPLFSRTLPVPGPARPLVISSANGVKAIEKAMSMLAAEADALDAVIAAVNIVEDDPNDMSVGYGGLPNEDGIVELDAGVMHGPTHRAGAVAALRNIKNPSKVARLVMERTDHVLLVGEGALRFAKAHGFREEDLLTDKAREAWLQWKETHSDKDDWLPPHERDSHESGSLYHPEDPFGKTWGTIHCSAIDVRGNISCVTTTSGLAYKIAGRVGDSPIIGAGLYADNEVGAAGSTGRGESNLVNCSSVMIVEWMRQGKSPEEACLMACRRVVAHTTESRLKDIQGRPAFSLKFYALNKNGEFGGASLYGDASIAVHDGSTARLVPIPSVYNKPAAK